MNEKNSAPIPSPTQNPENAFPAWRLPNGTINATDGQLDGASLSCEMWEWGFAGLVVAAVAAEIIIAYVHPPYDSLLNEWGAVTADVAIAIGIAGEVIFGRLDARIQTELRSRSNARLGKAILLAEQLRADNLALQTVMLPRHVGLFGINETPRAEQYFAGISEFRGTTVFIQTVDNDREVANLANEILIVLLKFGLRPVRIDETISHVSSAMIPDGAVVMYPTGQPWTKEEPNQPWFVWSRAAEALANALTSAGLGVGEYRVSRGGLSSGPSLHPGVTPFFDPPLEGVYLQIGSRPVSGTIEWIKRGRPDELGVRAKL
jgi:hypothetical protein